VASQAFAGKTLNKAEYMGTQHSHKASAGNVVVKRSMIRQSGLISAKVWSGVVIEPIIESRSYTKIAQTPEKARRLIVVPSPEFSVKISIVFVVLALIVSK
jgi:hypothetical protein